MYRAHSKDINRNKSFHPLTFNNLRRVEQLKEACDERKQAQTKRDDELRRDQEKSRYDELIVGSSTPDSSSLFQAHFRQVKNIFAAEYEASNALDEDKQVREKVLPCLSDNATDAEFTMSKGRKTQRMGTNILSKFHKVQVSMDDVCAKKSERQPKAEMHAISDGELCESPSQRVQLHRSDAASHDTNTGANTHKTGFISVAEALKSQKELELTRKQKLDPLRRVMEFQNSVVSSVAQAQQSLRAVHDNEQKHCSREGGHIHASTKKNDSQKLSTHIHELLDVLRSKTRYK